MMERDFGGLSGSKASPEAAKASSPVGYDPGRCDALYLLWASQGEYSDRSEWPIAAYTNEADAEADVILAGQLWRKLTGGGYVAWDKREKLMATDDGRRLAAIMGLSEGEHPSFYDEITFSRCRLEVRTTYAGKIHG